MMTRAAALLFLLVGVFGECDTSTCYVCQEMPNCVWITLGGISDCRKNDTVLTELGATITAAGQCPTCQAGLCTECQNQTGCEWYTPSSILMKSVCADAAPPPTPTGSYTLQPNCPACKDTQDCVQCNTAASVPGVANCSWYALPGGTGGKCAEESPGFAYTKVTASFCNGGNPCGGIDTCAACQEVNGTLPDGSMGNPCKWLTPKQPALYNAKCDYDNGAMDKAFYDVATTCPICGGTTCTACKSETENNCNWVAVNFGLTQGFGQCVAGTNAPAGKTIVQTCPAVCEIHSCTQCIAIPECRWYYGAASRDKCDRASDSYLYPFADQLAAGGMCPECAANRCYECNNLAGCSWFVNTLFGADVPGTGDCEPTPSSQPSNSRIVPNTDKKCDGAPNAAGLVAPGLLSLAVGFLVYHN